MRFYVFEKNAKNERANISEETQNKQTSDVKRREEQNDERKEKERNKARKKRRNM